MLIFLSTLIVLPSQCSIILLFLLRYQNNGFKLLLSVNYFSQMLNIKPQYLIRILKNTSNLILKTNKQKLDN
jgi:hypothetical protein